MYPCEWNTRPDHCMYGMHCQSSNTNGASIIHGNREVFHNEKQPAFKALYQGFRDVSKIFNVLLCQLNIYFCQLNDPIEARHFPRILILSVFSLQHPFDGRLEDLLRTVKSNMSNSTIMNMACGRVSHIFTKQLEKQIKEQRKKSKQS